MTLVYAGLALLTLPNLADKGDWHASEHKPLDSNILKPLNRMESSIFSYSITRPYPLRWFTPVTVVGGTVALVLFSFLNLLSTGYYQRYN